MLALKHKKSGQTPKVDSGHHSYLPPCQEIQEKIIYRALVVKIREASPQLVSKPQTPSISELTKLRKRNDTQHLSANGPNIHTSPHIKSINQQALLLFNLIFFLFYFLSSNHNI